MVPVLLITLALPYSPLKGILGLTPLPFSSLMLLASITLTYAAASELTKRSFFARMFAQETKAFSELCLPRVKSKRNRAPFCSGIC